MKTLKKFASLVSLGAALVAIVLFLVLPAISITSKYLGELQQFTGWQVAFGYSKGDTLSVTLLEPSFVSIAALVLLVGGMALTMLSGNGKNVKKLFALLAVVAYGVGGILLFLSGVGANLNEVIGLADTVLAVGSIIPGILAFGAAFFALIKML